LVDRQATAGPDRPRLILPLPPPDNHAYVASVRYRGPRPIVRRVRTQRNRDFQAEAGWLAAAWRLRVGWRVPEPGVAVRLRYWTFWPDRRRRDGSNLLKPLLDALEGVLYLDDAFVLPQAVAYAVDRQNPRLELELEIEPP